MFVALKLDRRKAWSRLLLLMQNKKGWARIPVIERLYSISGENPLAKKIFDKYFESVLFNIKLDVSRPGHSAKVQSDRASISHSPVDHKIH